MKLIAAKDFLRTPQLADVEIKNAVHPGMFHKGATFEIGTGPTLKELSKDERQLVGQLHLAGCVADATDEKAVKAIEDEIATDKRREENHAKLDAKLRGDGLGQDLAAILSRLARQGK